MYLEQIIVEISELLISKYGCKYYEHVNINNPAAATFDMDFLHQKIDRNVFWIRRCFRPDDTRTNHKTIRSAIHHQFQIVFYEFLDPFTLCKDVISGLGLNVKMLTLIPDNWKNDCIKSYGKGWELHYNGLEICQITFLNMLGGIETNKTTIEIVFGLERLSLLLNDFNKSYYELSHSKSYNMMMKKYNEYCYHIVYKDGNINLFDKFKNLYVELKHKCTIKDKNIHKIYNIFLKMSHVYNFIINKKYFHFSYNMYLMKLMSNAIDQYFNLYSLIKK